MSRTFLNDVTVYVTLNFIQLKFQDWKKLRLKFKNRHLSESSNQFNSIKETIYLMKLNWVEDCDKWLFLNLNINDYIAKSAQYICDINVICFKMESKVFYIYLYMCVCALKIEISFPLIDVFLNVNFECVYQCSFNVCPWVINCWLQ